MGILYLSYIYIYIYKNTYLSPDLPWFETKAKPTWGCFLPQSPRLSQHFSSRSAVTRGILKPTSMAGGRQFLHPLDDGESLVVSSNRSFFRILIYFSSFGDHDYFFGIRLKLSSKGFYLALTSQTSVSHQLLLIGIGMQGATGEKQIGKWWHPIFAPRHRGCFFLQRTWSLAVFTPCEKTLLPEFPPDIISDFLIEHLVCDHFLC